MEYIIESRIITKDIKTKKVRKGGWHRYSLKKYKTMRQCLQALKDIKKEREGKYGLTSTNNIPEKKFWFEFRPTHFKNNK